MGRKPVQILAGLAMVGATLVGCESSRSYQGGRSGGASTIGSTTPSQGWNNSAGVAGRQTGTPGGTMQQMPAGQPGGQQPAFVRPNTPGSSGVNSGTPLGSSPYPQTPSVSERQPAWNGTAPAGVDRTPRSTTPGVPVSNPNTTRPSIPDSGPGTSSRLSAPSAPMPVTTTPYIESPSGTFTPDPSTSRRIEPAPVPLPQGTGQPVGAGAPVLDSPPVIPPPGQ